MTRFACFTAIVAVSLWFAATTFAQPVIDGSWDPVYQVLAVQDTQTGFGDSNLGQIDYANGSELDVAYGTYHSGWLYLLLAGNLESKTNWKSFSTPDPVDKTACAETTPTWTSTVSTAWETTAVATA